VRFRTAIETTTKQHITFPAGRHGYSLLESNLARHVLSMLKHAGKASRTLNGQTSIPLCNSQALLLSIRGFVGGIPKRAGGNVQGQSGVLKFTDNSSVPHRAETARAVQIGHLCKNQARLNCCNLVPNDW
ncbi:hypothetical protein NEUTE2DRAFT_51587, partial [Neurospora tetrasperma FGSC 2509]